MEVSAAAFVKHMKFLAQVTLLALAPLFAQAAPVVWHLDGVTFSDGGTASGTFTYDADTNTYSAIAISTTTGSVVDAASYDALNPAYGSFAETLVVVNSADGPDFLGDPVFYPVFSAPLTNSGGTVTFVLIDAEASCGNSACSTAAMPWRNITGGTVSTDTTATFAQQIPALPLSGLIFIALGLVAAAGRRLYIRKRTA